jgi:cytoskeletal protein CcmA (bactofilin family)
MWNKRREEETTKCDASPSPVVASASLATNPLEIGKEVTPVSSILMAKAELDSLAGSATIGKTVKFVGQVYSKEDLVVDGDLEGTVEALDHKLTIGPTGAVHASVKAREVVVLGTLQGNVEAADRIEIRRDAKVMGDLRMARILIEDGAYFKGSIDIVKPEPVKAPANRQAAVLAAAPNQAAGTVGESTDIPIYRQAKAEYAKLQ